MSAKYTDLLRQSGIIVFDGAMGTQIQKQNLNVSDFDGHTGCPEILNITRPNVISAIHKEYCLAGAQVIETNTFGANTIKLSEWGLAERANEINCAGITCAKKATAGIPQNQPVFICGTMGPTGLLPSAQNKADKRIELFDTIAQAYQEQSHTLISSGADVLLLETMQDLIEARAAMIGINRAQQQLGTALPVQIHVSMDQSGHMLYGSDVGAVLGALVNLHPVAIGLNCNTGPAEMARWCQSLCDISPLPVAMVPNAGMPENIDGTAHYHMGPEEFAKHIYRAITNTNIAIVGGCCGTTPDHIRALHEVVKNHHVAPLTHKPAVFLGSGLGGVNIETEKRPFIIGERLNAQGSKKTKELLLANDFNALAALAREQQETTSAVLDLCVAVNERDNEAETMAQLVTYLSSRITTPFCLDSTEPDVIARAFKTAPGSVFINSINLEKNGEKARQLLPLAKEFGCPIVALTIDDNGMAKTVDQKLACAQRLKELACKKYGLLPEFLYIDPLVFTLATGEKDAANAAQQSIEALIRISAEMPEVRTIMGVSNVSFGLKPAARRVLNNLMLYHAGKAGLSAAIYNPLHLDDIAAYGPDIRQKGENLIFNTHTNALMDFINCFEQSQEITAKNTGKPKTDNRTPCQHLRDAILLRDRSDLAVHVANSLKTVSAQEMLDDILLPAMAEVGDKMARGDMVLPFVLQAAEIMQEIMVVLGPHLKASNATNKGTIVLATVYGDVHDIGKNLVASIVKNQGYTVIDLGKQTPLEQIINAVETKKPDALGLSALLVTTSREMKSCIIELDKRGLKVPVLIGGAAVNKNYAAQIAQLPDGRLYEGGVFYAKDAFEGTKHLAAILSGTAVKQTAPFQPLAQSPAGTVEFTPESDSPEHIEYTTVEPPFFGTSSVLSWDTQELLNAIDTPRLFKGEWKAGNLGAEGFEQALGKDFTPAFTELSRRILDEQLIDARGFYGFFPVITEGDMLTLLDPADFSKEIVTWKFPRVKRTHNRSIAEFLRPEGDVLAIQIVTIGSRLSETCRDYFSKSERYTRGFYLHGIGAYITEHLADRITTEIRRALFLGADQGRRYSFGFPGLPGIEEQNTIFECMAIEERLNVRLTERFQMAPEHSTLGIFVHSGSARYL